MTERPILFSAPMVRALLAGSKTQTRRALKPQPFDFFPVESGNHLLDYRQSYGQVDGVVPISDMLKTCPYGQPGDRLWVREAWRVIDVADRFAPRELTAAHRIWFEADGPPEPPAGRYRPGMFMPRWASRITLEVAGVRVERLQDISEADARAEGARECDLVSGREVLLAGPSQRGSFVLHYRDIWEQINGDGSWEANPWVWVVEFKKIGGAA